jgi:hypothetical protein
MEEEEGSDGSILDIAISDFKKLKRSISHNTTNIIQTVNSICEFEEELI